MISIPIVMFIIFLASSIPSWTILLVYLILKIVGCVESRKQRKHLKQVENELNEKIHIVLTRDKDELDND